MKRRLALLLALSLSFASFPVAGVGAAEADTPAAATQAVVEAEETKPEETEEATENEDAGTDKSGEAAVEAASTETAEVTEPAEEEENAEVTEEAAAAQTTEAAPEEEASTEATTIEEAAAVEEPEVAEEPAAEQKAEEQKPAATPVPAKVDPKTVKKQTETKKVADGWYSNNTVYYKNGKKVTGLQYIALNGVTRTFFFNSSGVKQTGWKTIDNKGTVCYFADRPEEDVRTCSGFYGSIQHGRSVLL